MIRRMVSMFAGGVMAVGASQAPEFAQQYNQRLGGAVDELRTVVVGFDADARRNGMNREQGLARMETAQDRFVAARGEAQRQTIARFERLSAQKSAMDAPDVWTRVFSMVRGYDAEIGRRAMGDFRPAVPLTIEGLFFGLIGFLAGVVIVGIAVLPMGRRRAAQPGLTRRSAP
ncbi:MAG: DUF2937 family protein [Beijerinckiaceae bacterium]